MHDLEQLRLFLEEICCEICRHRHVRIDGLEPESITIMREVRLPASFNYADIEVRPGAAAPYFVDIKWGHSTERILERLTRKYSENPNPQADKLVVVTDATGQENWRETESVLRSNISRDLAIEVWDERDIIRQLEDCFGIRIEAIAGSNYQSIRDAILRSEWQYAFGDLPDRGLAPTLLWHFSSWHLKRLRDRFGIDPENILRADIYRNVVIVMADLCSFSSYVRDTHDEAIVRHALTAFYSLARQAVLDNEGMLDKFVGDEVLGLFAFPINEPQCAENALRCAMNLIEVGASISKHWQDRIDRLQKSGGVHIGIGMGDLNLMPLRSFSRSHFGFVGDGINLTARLMAAAGPSEIVVSNSYYSKLPPRLRAQFAALEAVEGKNVGLVKCWRWAPIP